MGPILQGEALRQRSEANAAAAAQLEEMRAQLQQFEEDRVCLLLPNPPPPRAIPSPFKVLTWLRSEGPLPPLPPPLPFPSQQSQASEASVPLHQLEVLVDRMREAQSHMEQLEGQLAAQLQARTELEAALEAANAQVWGMERSIVGADVPLCNAR